MEGENVVAYGRPPSPAPTIKVTKKKGENACLNRKILIESQKDRIVKSAVKLYNFIIHYTLRESSLLIVELLYPK